MLLESAHARGFKALVATTPMQEPEYDVYPPNLWEPLRTRRYVCGEDLYASIEIPREDRAGRLRQLANNTSFFGAPVGLFFCLDRKVGPPQWSDVGMFMQTFMLLAVERGLATCAQEFWARYPKTVAEFVALAKSLPRVAASSPRMKKPAWCGVCRARLRWPDHAPRFCRFGRFRPRSIVFLGEAARDAA